MYFPFVFGSNSLLNLDQIFYSSQLHQFQCFLPPPSWSYWMCCNFDFAVLDSGFKERELVLISKCPCRKSNYHVHLNLFLRSIACLLEYCYQIWNWICLLNIFFYQSDQMICVSFCLFISDAISSLIASILSFFCFTILKVFDFYWINYPFSRTS